MSKTIAQIFNEFDDDVKREVYRIVGWSLEHNRVHPVIKQFESDSNGDRYRLYSSNDWWWFGKLTEEQRICIAAIVKEAAREKEE